ncbi:MAG: hypothetical protein ABIS68_03335 [Casimicrobiaceae bacterium]
MQIELSSLTATDLDQLIAAATTMRATLSPPVPATNPQGEIQAIGDPKWFLTSVPGGTLLQIRHPGHGWLNFHIPALSRAFLLSFLLQQALIETSPQTPAATPQPPATASGGTTVH